MKQSRLLPGLLVSVLAVVSLPGLAQSPPKNLKKVGDHWTAWDPPPATEGAYLIQKGDTLWDLAGQWLGDPYLWPQVWDLNRYVLDSHWIYPGDPLMVPGRPTVVPPEGPPPTDEAPEEPDTADTGGYGRTVTGEQVGEPGGPGAGEGLAPLLPLGSTDEIYCSGHIEPDHEPSGLTLAAIASEKMHVSAGDVVYLSHGTDWGLEPGDEFAVTRPGALIRHPQTGHELGIHIKRLGRLRVMLVQGNMATAVIEMACLDLRVGDELVPWADIPVPMARSLPPFLRWDAAPSGGATGYVVSTSDKFEVVGPGHVIHTDLGAASGLRPGDVLTFYRTKSTQPRTNLAQGIVLTVEPTTSTVKVMNAVQEVYVGDEVEVVR